MAQRRRLLLLAANPIGTQPLRLDEEAREIQSGLGRASRKAVVEVTHAWAARARDVRRAMLDAAPDVVHFSGHGSGEEGLVFEADDGRPALVTGEALSGLFSLFENQVHCVVLNACFSEAQARAISEHVPFVIGMRREIGDRAALEFAIGFYDALAAGKQYEQAFDFGCNAIQLAGLTGSSVPTLWSRGQPPVVTSQAVSRRSGRPVARGLQTKSFAELLASGTTVDRIIDELIRLDYENLTGLDDVAEGTIAQWVSVAENNPDGYAFLVNQSNDLAAYWHFEALQDDLFDRAVRGELEESEITVDRTRTLCTPGNYDIYFVIYLVGRAYRGYKTHRIMLDAFLDRVEDLADQGMLIRRICANAFTAEGVGLCRSLNMKYLRPHARAGQIYSIALEDATEILRARPKLITRLHRMR